MDGVQKKLEDIETLRWDFNRAKEIACREGIFRREKQIQYLRLSAEKNISDLLQETIVIKTELNQLLEEDRKWKDSLSKKYGVDFQSPKTCVNLDTGEITQVE